MQTRSGRERAVNTLTAAFVRDLRFNAMNPPGTEFGARIAAAYEDLRPLDAGLERLVDDVARAGDMHFSPDVVP
jgi:hypothetical protein